MTAVAAAGFLCPASLSLVDLLAFINSSDNTEKKLQRGRMVPEHSGWSSQTLSVGSCSDGNSLQGQS